VNCGEQQANGGVPATHSLTSDHVHTLASADDDDDDDDDGDNIVGFSTDSPTPPVAPNEGNVLGSPSESFARPHTNQC